MMMDERDFTSARAKEALLKDQDKYCGGCCWFYGEQTDGEGMCIVHQFDGDDLPWYCCTMSACADYVSCEEMRRHMAVLLQNMRFLSDKSEFTLYRPVRIEDLHKAQEFAYKYMKVFSKL